MQRRHRILEQMSYAVGARYLAQGLRIARGFGLAHFLGPAGFGAWSAMRVVLQFAGYAELGARSGMLQHATREEAAGHAAQADRTRGVAGVINLAGALLVAVVITALVSLPGLEVEQRGLWWLLACVVVAQNAWMYMQASLRSRQRFGLSSSLSVLFAVLTTTLGLAGAWWSGLGGFLAALLLSYLLVHVVSVRFGSGWPPPIVDRERARVLLDTGFPIMLGDLLKVLMWNVDKILVWAVLGHHALGVYALQATITNGIMLLPAGAAEVFYPHLVASIGRSKSVAAGRQYLTEGIELLVGPMSAILAVAFLALHLPIRWWLPDYQETIAPGRVLILAAFFPIAGTVAAPVLVALGGQRRHLLASACGVVAAAAGVTLAMLAGGGFVQVALGAAAGLVTRAAISTAGAMARAQLETSARLRLVGRLAARFAFLLLVVAGVAWLIPEAAATPLEDVLRTSLRCLLALALFAPWLVQAWRSHRRHASQARPRPESDEATEHA